MTVAGVVGRDREMAAVAAFLDAVPAGPAGLLLEGAAGIGKSTVWSAGAACAAGRSFTVLSSRPAESEATLSFAALGDLLDGVLDQALARLPPPQRQALEVALLIADPAGSPPALRAVAVAFLAVIRHLSASGPVVIAIDDLQWLDVPSARALEFALRRLSQEPAGLLASIRIQADEHTSSRLAIGPAAGRTTRLRMDPLTLDVFEGVLRASAGAGLSRLTIRRLFDASGGNPFYGLELARALQRADAEPSPEEPLPVPAGLHGVLSARLDALPADARDALLVASCLRSPTTAMLEQASDVELLGRVDKYDQYLVSGYHFRITSSGAWRFYTVDASGNSATLAAGHASFGIGVWHRLALAFRGGRATVKLDGQPLATVAATAHTTGQVGMSVGGWTTAQFDRLSVRPAAAWPQFAASRTVTATATSEQNLMDNQASYPAGGAVDGRVESCWWSRQKPGPAASLPQAITVHLSQARTVYGLAYRPPINQQGNITTYAVYLSNDGRRFSKVAAGNWPEQSATQIASWHPQRARFVRLEALGTENYGAAACEVQVALSPLNPADGTQSRQ